MAIDEQVTENIDLMDEVESPVSWGDPAPKPVVTVALRDQVECQVIIQDLELKIRRVVGLSAVLIEEKPGWIEMAKRYIHWYHSVEEVIKTMLGHLGIEVVSTRDSTGQHTHHEDILGELSQPQNPFYELIGRDDILFLFRQAKDDRNVCRGLGKGSALNRTPPDFNAFSNRIRAIERVLWSSLAFFRLEYSRRQEHARDSCEKERGLYKWEAILHAEQQNLGDRESRIQQEEERLKDEAKKVEDTQERKAQEEQNREAEIDNQKRLDAALKKERKAQEDAIKKEKAELIEQEKKSLEAAKQLKTKTQLTKDNEKLKKDLRDLKIDRPDVQKLETKNKNQAAEIRRLEEKARVAEESRQSAHDFCAKELLKEKEVFRKSLARMREADGVVAQAELTKLEQALREEHKTVIESLNKVHEKGLLDRDALRDALLSSAKDVIQMLEKSVNKHQEKLEKMGQAHEAEIKSLQDAHVEALKAQYEALMAECERVKQEASGKRRSLFFF